MRHVATLLRRELGAYFLNPMAYLILLAMQAIACFNFFALVDVLSRPRASFSTLSDPMNAYISGSEAFWFAILVAVPALTMRLIAEERRSKTIEGLLTAPVSEVEIVVAKWLAGLLMYMGLLIPFSLYLPVLRSYGQFPFDVGPLLSLGIGLTTIGMMFAAIGIFFSAMSRNQIEAFIGTFIVLSALIYLTWFGYRRAEARRAPWTEAMRFVTLREQMLGFGAGQLDLRYLGLHLSVAALMLFLTVKVLAGRRGT